MVYSSLIITFFLVFVSLGTSATFSLIAFNPHWLKPSRKKPNVPGANQESAHGPIGRKEDQYAQMSDSSSHFRRTKNGSIAGLIRKSPTESCSADVMA